MATFQGEANTQAGFIFVFFSVSVFTTGLVTDADPPSPLSLRDFLLTLIQGFVDFIQGLPLNSDFWNGVHSVDESVISSRTHDVDLFTSIASSPSLPPCS